ncbi:PDDEXK family nuclease [Fulvitalea axinellae]|uniref:hypothetical protein n=1 Tax=Fulvitalea axinellae TaxID=1182444 RepID=UPI0030CA2C76
MDQELIEFIRSHSHAKHIQDTKEGINFPELNLTLKFHHVRDGISISGQQLQAESLESIRNGIRLVRIWEDEWVFRKKIIKSRILSLLGQTQRIYGRQTHAEPISAEQLKDFLTENHLQIPLKAKHKYGLYHRGRLVAVMAFSKGRFIERDGKKFHSFELMRHCNALGKTVIGGMDKLLKHFIQEHQPDDIMSYADLDWSDGNAYKRVGFELVETTPAQHFWVDMESGQRVYPNKVHQLIKKELETGLTEDDIMFGKGYYKVFNSGNLKFLKLINK